MNYYKNWVFDISQPIGAAFRGKLEAKIFQKQISAAPSTSSSTEF